MGKELNYVVETMLKKHGGGSQYFDELDMRVATPEFMEQLLKQVFRKYESEDIIFVVSGRFALEFYEQYNEQHNIISVNGGLRHGLRVQVVKENCYKMNFNKHAFIFLDDSLYKGRTLEKIGTVYDIKETFVIYDGSSEQFFNVNSLYRYYDYHDKNGNKI